VVGAILSPAPAPQLLPNGKSCEDRSARGRGARVGRGGQSELGRVGVSKSQVAAQPEPGPGMKGISWHFRSIRWGQIKMPGLPTTMIAKEFNEDLMRSCRF
jgi:hypothetical protein